jgi:hypothetical protein
MTEVQTTQGRHPWRATTRTVVAATVGFLPLLPEIVHLLGAESLPWVAGIVAVAGSVTRVLAIPGVNTWLHTYGLTSWLAANPPPTPPSGAVEAPLPAPDRSRYRWPEDRL